jgi:hypothetical protein
MQGDVNFEIGLSWDRRDDVIRTFLRIDRPGTTTDEMSQSADPLEIDLDRLKAVPPDDEGYGKALTEMLMRPADVGRLYTIARNSTQQAKQTLHVRLHLDAHAPPEYHAVRWETLVDPVTGGRIATASDVLFSRYVSSADWRPIPTRPRHELKGLVIVSAPTDLAELEDGTLAAIDRTAERTRARAALAGFHQVKELAGDERATLPAILAAVEERVDVLYLVCHGLLSDDVPQLLLENSDGTGSWVDGRTLVDRLTELEHRPTIAMLCSCQSAGRPDGSWTVGDGPLAALGPSLASAGVAAVVAMQDNFSLESAEVFGPTFFSELRSHGEVDRAMASARRAIGERPDWWVPVLFSRLRSSRPYYRPEFADEASGTWTALESALSARRLTPVLGPGLADAILTSRQELAARLVERWQLPIAPPSRGDLAQVAQFLRVRFDDGTARDLLIGHLKIEITRRATNDDQMDPFRNVSFDVDRPGDAILEAGRRLREMNRQMNRDDPYRIAALLPVPVYVTTAWTNLLEEALTEVGRKPATMRFHWNVRDQPDDGGGPEPTLKRPLVYHLFGHLDEPESLVFSEDDYFAWLAAWLKRQKAIPGAVQKALTSRSLLFLGFQLDDWDFRVVLNAIKSFEGSAKLQKRQHAGVQLSPETALIEADAAQEYLESYFDQDNVKIYWGDTADFLGKFQKQAKDVIDSAWAEP